MTSIVTMWENYVTLFKVLTDWMTRLVGRPEAEATARRALAMLARLSWNGYQTQEGPFAELVGMCCADMASHGLLGAHGELVMAPGPDVVPDETGMLIFVALYAASYQAAYDGQWSMMEREQVYQYLRMHNPRSLLTDQDDMIESAPDPLQPLLRRALHDRENWFGPATMVGIVAQSIADDESIRSLFWLRQFSG